MTAKPDELVLYEAFEALERWIAKSQVSAAEAGRILRRVEAGELIAPAEARLWAESFDRLWQDMAKGHHTIKSLLDRARPRLTPPDDVV